MVDNLRFSNPHHIGVIVKDLEKAIEHYQSMGIGPFESPFGGKGPVALERKSLGKPLKADALKLRARMARVGPVFLEIIQPITEGSLWKEFLEKNGEGINHLGFMVDDMTKERAEMASKGFRELYSSEWGGGAAAVYFDTRRVGGIIFELMQLPRT